MRERSNEPREITLRGIGLGAAITFVFTSANLYLGLKTGMTFSSSIPAAIISMSLLKLFGGGNILENNIVQTQASAAGTLCNVILVIPGLIIAHVWDGFPMWETIGLCALGGLFGVVYSVPLRRVMVVQSDLPFPEGVAAAEVLRSGHEEGQQGGLRVLAASGAAAAALNLLTSGFKLIPAQLVGSLSYGRAVFRFGGSLSLALIGVGYLVRVGACLALLIGVALAWGIAVPVLTAFATHGASADQIWSDKVRLIGAGIIAVGGIWTVATLAKPLLDVFRSARGGDDEAKAGGRDLREERDIPLALVGGSLAALFVPAGVLFAVFAAGHHLSFVAAVFIVLPLVAAFGFLMAAACGYMAGLLGSSSSPISGIGILSTIVVAVALAFADRAGGARSIVAVTLFVTSFVVTISSIANDNLQDLKTGQIVGATPWKQQAILAVGVLVGAVTVGPVLQLLFNAYGFVGALPHPGMNAANALPAPQAALMTQIATGIVGGRLPWSMVGIGAGLGFVFIAAETLLRRRGFSLPALTVGIGMYLPLDVVVTIALGGVVGWAAERVLARRASTGRSADELEQGVRRRGVLIASGFLVGESLVGVLIALADTIAGRSGSLAFHVNTGAAAPTILGLVIFAGLLAAFFWATSRPTIGGASAVATAHGPD